MLDKEPLARLTGLRLALDAPSEREGGLERERGEPRSLEAIEDGG